jgi:negative regulator of replication initiation
MNSASVLFDARQNKHILKTLTHLRTLINQFHSERQKAINVLVLIQREFYQFNAFSFVQEYKDFPRARLETVCATTIEKYRRELLNIM